MENARRRWTIHPLLDRELAVEASTVIADIGRLDVAARERAFILLQFASGVLFHSVIRGAATAEAKPFLG